MANTVLVATEDNGLSQQLRTALEAEDMTVLRAATADEAIAVLNSHQCDLTILQPDLPGDAGGTLPSICQRHTRAVILLLNTTPVSDVVAEALAEGLGGRADDAESRLEPGIYHLRALDGGPVKAHESRSLRRLTLGDLVLDLDRHHLTVGSRTAALTPVQTRILQALMEHSPRIMSLEQLTERVWPDGEGSMSDLAEGIYSLRAILGAGPSGASRIRHLSGYGLTISPRPEP